MIQNRNMADVIVILMDGRIKQSCWSAEATPGQLCRFSHLFHPFLINVNLFFFSTSTKSKKQKQGNPQFFIAVIAISVWNLRSGRGGGRGKGDDEVSPLTKMH